MQKQFKGRNLFFAACFFCLLPPFAANAQQTEPSDSLFFYEGNFNSFQQRAAFENKPYLVFFTAPWCAPCHRLINEVFPQPKISAILKNSYLLYRIDLDDLNDAQLNKSLFNVEQLPTILFFDPKGKRTDSATGFFDGYYLFKKLRAHIPPSQRGSDWGME